MYLNSSVSPVRGGDLVMRPKKTGFGLHYGTALDNGLIAHTTPERGKHVSTLEEFSEGKPVSIKRPNRTMIETSVVQQRAVSDLGTPYAPANQNCEHDVTLVHDGVKRSPTVQSVVIGLTVGAVLGLAVYSKELGIS